MTIAADPPHQRLDARPNSTDKPPSRALSEDRSEQFLRRCLKRHRFPQTRPITAKSCRRPHKPAWAANELAFP